MVKKYTVLNSLLLNMFTMLSYNTISGPYKTLWCFLILIILNVTNYIAYIVESSRFFSLSIVKRTYFDFNNCYSNQNKLVWQYLSETIQKCLQWTFNNIENK